MDGFQLALLLLAALLVFLNGFFVAAEFAFVKVRASRIEQLVREGAGSSSRVARRILSHLDGYLSACQFGITLASLGLGWVGEPALGALIEPPLRAIGLATPATVHAASVVLAFTLITFLHVVVGEQAPKSLGIMRAETVALWSAWPLRLFYAVAYPAIALLNGSTNLLLRSLGLPPASEHEHAHSPEELSMVVETSHEHGLLDAEQRALLDNALALRKRCVREIMVPRPDMHCLLLDRPVEVNVETLRRWHHTRYPLAEQQGERIHGMVHIKDLLPFGNAEAAAAAQPLAVTELLAPRRLRAIARPITFVPEVAPIDRALRTFQASGCHMAMVVDEWGGVVGLVTLEDVLEELVGEIRDEFDREGEEVAVWQGPDGVMIARGSWSLSEAAERLGVAFEGARVDTLGGYVMQRLGRVPKIGDAIEIGPWRVEVGRMRGHRVTALRLSRCEPADREPVEHGGSGEADGDRSATTPAPTGRIRP